MFEMSTPHAGEARLPLDGIVSENSCLVSADLIANGGAGNVEDDANNGAVSASQLPESNKPFPQPHCPLH